MFRFKPGDLVKVKGDVMIERINLSGSSALVTGFEHDNMTKDLHEVLNREIPYIIICGGIETYAWDEELEEFPMEDD
jgi:hypothetical protein